MIFLARPPAPRRVLDGDREAIGSFQLASAPTPKATNLDNWSDDWAAALGSGKKSKGFDDAPPAPSTRELLAFLDTYDDGQRPEFPDEVLPASEFPPPPSPSMKEVSLEDDRTGESTL